MIEASSERSRVVWLWGAAIFIISLAIFLTGVQSPRDIYFDETWYVPTARAFLKTGEVMHQEHPPLGKLLIALSMSLFGDNPLGWRALSALFGAITVFAIWLWTLALTRDARASLFAALVSLADAILFVQARIAMLDIFLMAFSMLSMAFFTLSMKERERPDRAFAYALAMGVCLGLAGACKWSGFFLAFGLIAIRLLIGLLRTWKVSFDDPSPTDFYTREPDPAWSPLRSALAFGVAPFLAYFLTFIPQMLHEASLFEFVASHKRMFDILSGHSPDHPYMSLWYTWPLDWRPVWYLFDVPGHDTVKWSDANPAAAVVGLANPVVVYGGEVAILVAAWRWLTRRDLDSMIVAVAFFAQFLPWMINPKGLEFAYYFYPSILCLGPALALVFFPARGPLRVGAAWGFLALAALWFVYFLPILAAGVGVGPDGFAARMWLPGWR